VQVPEAASYYSLEASTIVWKFPEPGYLEGVKTKDKAILKMTQMNFAYPGADKNILNDVNVQARARAAPRHAACIPDRSCRLVLRVASHQASSKQKRL
jgi:hypothetical protein